MKRAGIERIKNAVIVFLLIITVALSVCAVFILLPDIGIGKNLTTEVSGSADSGYKISTGVSAEAARPFCIVVTDDSGEHYGVKYNSDDVDEAYNILSGSFGESIGSAKKEPQKISEEKWRYALMSPGAYFEYNDSVPLNVLAGWFGTETQKTWESFSVKRLCIIIKSLAYMVSS